MQFFWGGDFLAKILEHENFQVYNTILCPFLYLLSAPFCQQDKQSEM